VGEVTVGSNEGALTLIGARTGAIAG